MKPLHRFDDPEVPVWASYTDVAMNVIVVLLLYLFTQATLSTLNEAKFLCVRAEQRKMEKQVMDSLPQNLRSFVTVAEDGQLLRYRFADRVLFSSGEAELKDSGREILTAIGSAFSKQVGTFTRIQVEGHTDDKPIHTVQFPSNWELSSARATSVVRFLEDQSNLDPRLLSSTGYSQYQPVDPNDTTETGKNRNRRIEVVVVYTLMMCTSKT